METEEDPQPMETAPTAPDDTGAGPEAVRGADTAVETPPFTSIWWCYGYWRRLRNSSCHHA